MWSGNFTFNIYAFQKYVTKVKISIVASFIIENSKSQWNIYEQNDEIIEYSDNGLVYSITTNLLLNEKMNIILSKKKKKKPDATKKMQTVWVFLHKIQHTKLIFGPRIQDNGYYFGRWKGIGGGRDSETQAMV